jgi:hypothetical protein
MKARIIREVLLCRVLGDADHGGAWRTSSRGIRTEADADALSERLGLGPQRTCHRLADDGDAGRAVAIRVGEPAAAHNSRLHGAKIVRRRDLEVEATECLDRIDAIDSELRGVRAKETAVDPRRRDDSGNRLRGGEQLSADDDGLSAVHGITTIVGDGLDHRSRIIAQRNCADVLEASNEQSGADEQYDGQGGLYHDQHRANARPVTHRVTIG